MDPDSRFRVATVQVAPAVLDREATLDIVVARIDEAADAGARLVAFPETFVPGYPEWVWGLRPGDDGEAAADINDRLIAQSVDLETDGLARVREAAQRRRVTVVIGINEREGTFSRATLFNTVVIIGEAGSIKLSRRRAA